jgi:hypothetical protein
VVPEIREQEKSAEEELAELEQEEAVRARLFARSGGTVLRASKTPHLVKRV